jgi:tRNA pseudouridine32 synthase/23S rRNA pseudouridine746 synthase
MYLCYKFFVAIQILHEDDHLVAVSKPSGQVTIPGRGNLPGEPLSTELARQLGRKVFVVHRLDRGASGVVLFAKDSDTHRDLSLQFERREVCKTYLVLVQGLVKEDGHIDQPLRAFGSGRMGIHSEGKPSQTDFKIRERLPAATLLEVTPHTGRRHQIRVHLYSIGHPVMGDTLYGKERPVGGVSRLMLHAWSLEFKNLDQSCLYFKADLPLDFENVLTLLRSQ